MDYLHFWFMKSLAEFVWWICVFLIVIASILFLMWLETKENAKERKVKYKNINRKSKHNK